MVGRIILCASDIKGKGPFIISAVLDWHKLANIEYTYRQKLCITCLGKNQLGTEVACNVSERKTVRSLFLLIDIYSSISVTIHNLIFKPSITETFFALFPPRVHKRDCLRIENMSKWEPSGQKTMESKLWWILLLGFLDLECLF